MVIVLCPALVIFFIFFIIGRIGFLKLLAIGFMLVIVLAILGSV